MKKISLLLFICLPLLSYPDFWTQKASMPAAGRGQCVGVHIGNTGYLGLGKTATQYLNDWWKYDRSTNAWTQLSAFPGTARAGSVGFSADSNVYVAGGRDAGGLLNEVWLFSPANNAWLQKNNFPGSKKAQSMSFIAGTNIFIGGGINDTVPTYSKDFWQYNVVNDSWIQKNDLPGKARAEGIGMACNKIGYYGLGISAGDTLLSDFWQYDTLSDTWTALPPFPAGGRLSPSRFSLFNQVYIGTGFDTINLPGVNDWWQFDPTTQQWTAKAACGGTVSGDMISFSIFNNGYMGIGRHDSSGFTADFWEYSPDSLLSGISSPQISSQITSRIYPNPIVTSSIYEIKSDIPVGDLTLFIYDSTTRLLKRISISSERTILEKGNLKPGVYFYVLMRKTSSVSSGKFNIA